MRATSVPLLMIRISPVGAGVPRISDPIVVSRLPSGVYSVPLTAIYATRQLLKDATNVWLPVGSSVPEVGDEPPSREP